MEDLALVGKAVPRVESTAKATGRTRFVDDMPSANVLHGRVLRSPIPHARLVSIDASAALALPGVKAVITARDLSTAAYGLWVEDERCLARDEVRFVGDRVAAVAAISAEIADAALALIRVEYKEMPAVFDPLQALALESPAVHKDFGSYVRHGPLLSEGNACSITRISRGDVAVGFAQADLIFADRFTTPRVFQSHVERRATMAAIDPLGQVVVWAATPSVFRLREIIARILDLPLHRVRVIAAPVGGSYGGRNEARLEPICARLAQITGRPVKMSVDYVEGFADSTPRHAGIIDLRTGVTLDGIIVAREARLVLDTGAFAEFGPTVAFEAARQILGPYRIPNVKTESRAVYTNQLSSGCYRAHGTPQPTFASESQIDIIAARLGMDPLAFRLKNVMEDGDRTALGHVYKNTNLRELLRRVADEANWEQKGSGEVGPVRRGRGLALAQWYTGGRATGAMVKLEENGSAIVTTGAVDVTGSDTVLVQIVAEELGLPLSDVKLAPVDTDTSPFDAGSSGTRVVCNVGKVVREAAGQIKAELCQTAAGMLEANPQDLELRDRRIEVRGSPERGVPLATVAARLYQDRAGLIIGHSSSPGSRSPADPGTFEGVYAGGSSDFIHAAQVADVEVNTETGEVRVLHFTSAHDIGRAINILGTTSQIEGGIAQGIGYALYEELTIEDGRVLNPVGLAYPAPRADAVPSVSCILVEDHAGGGPFGAKGIAESPGVATAPAIANAIYNAVGVRMKDLPITPEKVLKALAEKEGSLP